MKMDKDGLTNIYRTLEQMDTALLSHREDAKKFDAEHGTGFEEDLTTASWRIGNAQSIIARVLSSSKLS